MRNREFRAQNECTEPSIEDAPACSAESRDRSDWRPTQSFPNTIIFLRRPCAVFVHGIYYLISYIYLFIAMLPALTSSSLEAE